MEAVDFISSLLIATLLGWWMTWFFNDFHRAALAVTWAWKVVGTITLVILFTYYYPDRSTSDIYRFYDDGIILKNLAFESPSAFLEIFFNTYDDTPAFRGAYLNQMNAWIKPYETGFYNHNHLMIRMNAIMAFFTGGQILIHSIFFSFLSFSGILLLIKTFTTTQSRHLALILVSILPSAWIWLSGGLKETVLVFSLGLIIYTTQRGSVFSIKKWLLLSIGIFIVIQIKVYFILALAPLLLWDILSKRLHLKQLHYWSLLLILGAISLIILEHSGFSPLHHIVNKQHDFINHINEINPGSAFTIPKLEENYLDLFLAAPLALVNALVRPFPWEPIQANQLVMIAENLYFFAVLLLGIYGYRQNKTAMAFPKWILPFCILILFLIGITTPVFGAIMRYKAPIMVLLIILLTPYLAPLFNKYLTHGNDQKPNI